MDATQQSTHFCPRRRWDICQGLKLKTQWMLLTNLKYILYETAHLRYFYIILIITYLTFAESLIVSMEPNNKKRKDWLILLNCVIYRNLCYRHKNILIKFMRPKPRKLSFQSQIRKIFQWWNHNVESERVIFVRLLQRQAFI